MPEEELRLDVFASYDDDDLERLEDDLENVDDAIAASGKGNREVNIDVDTDAIIAAGELEALDEVIESVDDDIEIGVETDTEDVPEGFADATESSSGDDTSLGLAGMLEQAVGSGSSDSNSDDSESDITVSATNLDEELEVDIDESFEMERVFEPLRQQQREIRDDSISLDDASDLVNRDADRSGVFKRAKNEFSDTISGATDGIKNFQFTIAAFNQVLVSVFPALLSFVGAIPAAIVALGGLAAAAITAMAALGAVGVLGLGGMALQGNGELDIQPIMDRLKGIFDAFITAFTPLMKTFVAPVKNAFNTIEALADPLAQAASGLTAFQSLFNDTLATVAQGLPSFTAKLVAFGQAAIPILRGFIQFVNNTNFIGFFAEQLQRASISIKIIIESVKQLLPFIINLSQGFLLVASVILGTISIVAAIANHFPLLTAAIGAVIGALLLLVTVTTLYSIVTASSAISAAIGFAGSLLKTAAAAIIAQTSLAGFVALLLPLTVLVAFISYGLIDLSSIFDDLTNSIMGTNDSLRQFHKLTGRSSFSSGFSGPGNPIGQAGGQGSNYDVSVVSDGDKDRAARSAYTSSYELKQREQTNSIFGS